MRKMMLSILGVALLLSQILLTTPLVADNTSNQTNISNQSTANQTNQSEERPQTEPLIRIEIGGSEEENTTPNTTPIIVQNITVIQTPQSTVRGLLVLLAMLIVIIAGLLYWKWDTVFRTRRQSFF